MIDPEYNKEKLNCCIGFSLEHPQRVGIVGIVGIEFTGSNSISTFCCPEPRPTTPSVDISTHLNLNEIR